MRLFQYLVISLLCFLVSCCPAPVSKKNKVHIVTDDITGKKYVVVYWSGTLYDLYPVKENEQKKLP